MVMYLQHFGKDIRVDVRQFRAAKVVCYLRYGDDEHWQIQTITRVNLTEPVPPGPTLLVNWLYRYRCCRASSSGSAYIEGWQKGHIELVSTDVASFDRAM